MTTAAKFIVISLVVFMVVALFVPSIRQIFTRMFTSSETVSLPNPDGSVPVDGEGQEYNIVTLLGFDAIPAILSPSFSSAEEAEAWMDSDEQVLGLSIKGEHRAYSVRMLSRHEIVNDVVGGVPVAVTW